LSEGKSMKSIDERIKNLPPALKKEVEEFVKGLLKKRRNKNGKKLRQLGRYACEEPDSEDSDRS